MRALRPAAALLSMAILSLITSLIAPLITPLITPAAQAAPKDGEPILAYIKRTWAALTRSNRTLATSAVDPKFHPEPGGRWPVYVAASEDRAKVEAQLRREIDPAHLRLIDIRTLPVLSAQTEARIPVPGLLYLPQPYVVPGGRFNEMYGWDSYFIVRGFCGMASSPRRRAWLTTCSMRSATTARFSTPLDSYYLTWSQPPFLTGMILAVYRRTHDRQWIADAMPAIETYYQYWVREPHLTRATGLSRYFDSGEGPAPEVMASERDPGGMTHYDRVLEYFRTNRVEDYDVSQYYDAEGAPG